MYKTLLRVIPSGIHINRPERKFHIKSSYFTISDVLHKKYRGYFSTKKIVYCSQPPMSVRKKMVKMDVRVKRKKLRATFAKIVFIHQPTQENMDRAKAR